MTDDGFVRVTGRTKDIVIRGGMNISVREVEDKLADHPDLLALAVVGMPDEKLGEKVCCYVVAKAGHTTPTVDELRDYLTSRGVAIQKTPERVIAIDELPMTATGRSRSTSSVRRSPTNSTSRLPRVHSERGPDPNRRLRRQRRGSASARASDFTRGGGSGRVGCRVRAMVGRPDRRRERGSLGWLSTTSPGMSSRAEPTSTDGR